MIRRSPSRHSPLARLVSALAAALVLLLGILAASPELHERIHGHGLATGATRHTDSRAADFPKAVEDEDGCVVTLFSQGLVLLLAVAGLSLSHGTARPGYFGSVDRVVPEQPRYMRLPAQAPPVGAS